MPSPVMPQASSVAAGAALAAMFCGMEKMPPATMEPTTSATISFKMIILGYPAILNITAYPVGDNQMRFIEYFTADDADLIQRYQGIAHKMIEAQYIIDHPNKK